MNRGDLEVIRNGKTPKIRSRIWGFCMAPDYPGLFFDVDAGNYGLKYTHNQLMVFMLFNFEKCIASRFVDFFVRNN